MSLSPSLSRRAAMRTVVTAAAAAVAAVAVIWPASAAHGRTTPSPNLIRNAGAEKTGKPPTSQGTKVPITSWTVAKSSNVTAVAYGAPDFPSATTPGPKSRGKNFFSGGPDGAVNTATQRDSLEPYASWIKSGKGHFQLSAWLGGYSDQNDNCVLSLTWTDAHGKSVGTAKVGPVSAAQRKNATGMLHRTASGTVPKTATAVLVRLTMRRTEGTFDDGYADALSLQLSRS